MRLRNGKIIGEKTPIKTQIKTKKPFDAFLEVYNKLKIYHTYNDLNEYLLKKDTNNMIKICSLYLAFTVFSQNHWIKEIIENLIEKLENNNLLQTSIVKTDDDNCYICGCQDYGELAIKCPNNHLMHLECFYQKVLTNLIPHGISFTCKVNNQCLYCDYCSYKII